jgi:hypothetical protein
VNYTSPKCFLKCLLSFSSSPPSLSERGELGNAGRVTLPFVAEQSLGFAALVPYLATLYFTSCFKCRGVFTGDANSSDFIALNNKVISVWRTEMMRKETV